MLKLALPFRLLVFVLRRRAVRFIAYSFGGDLVGADGKATQIVGGDGITRTKIEISGSYKGKDGTFEYIIEPDGKTVNHRLFVPN